MRYAVLTLIVLCLSGCGVEPNPRPPADPHPFFNATVHRQARAAAVAPEATACRVVELLAGCAFVAAVVLYFVLPEAHRISYALGGSAITVGGAALLARLSLWMLPWVATLLAALAASALVAFTLEVCLRVRSRKPATVLAALDDIPQAVAATLASVEQIAEATDPKAGTTTTTVAAAVSTTTTPPLKAAA